MMQNKQPSLLINRLVAITKGGKIAFDETFHIGVNIIRGDNGAGKSTISNLIFYALGGSFDNWTDAALNINTVFLEVNINNNILTLRRDLSSSSRLGMSIFDGNFDKASVNAAEGWKNYPYNTNPNTLSFSNMLFSYLGFPEIKNDADGNITMHQILRLIYIDQKSLTDSLMRTEQQYDNSLIRQTVFDLLTSVYNDEIYSYKIIFKNNEKELERKKTQLDGIEKIFQSSEIEINKDAIITLIENAENEIASIETEIQNFEKNSAQPIESLFPEEIKVLQNTLLEKKNLLSDIESNIGKLIFELSDSNFFILTLEKRLNALADSSETENILQGIKLNHCPQCMQTVKPITTETVCGLCKQELPSEENKSIKIRMIQELTLQKKESTSLMKGREEKITKLKIDLPKLSQEIKTIQKEIDLKSNQTKSSTEVQKEQLFLRKGALINKIETYTKQLKAAENYALLKKEEIELTKSNIEVQDRIKNLDKRNHLRKIEVANKIEEYALLLLRSDIGVQSEFKIGQKIAINLEKNSYTLDGKNNFSESSKIFLKNCIRYALLFASLDLDYMRYPRFLLCDNMEDKGMQKERTQNFQKKIIELSNKFSVTHQIIFTTSMIADELEGSKYCVGDFYQKDSKTLNFKF